MGKAILIRPKLAKDSKIHPVVRTECRLFHRKAKSQRGREEGDSVQERLLNDPQSDFSGWTVQEMQSFEANRVSCRSTPIEGGNREIVE